MKSIFRVACFFCLFPLSAACNEAWTPKLNFIIDGTSHKESVIFLSGISYALEYSNKAILMQDNKNFFCFDLKETIGLKLIIDILNKNLSGDVSAENVMTTLMLELDRKYPCE